MQRLLLLVLALAAAPAARACSQAATDQATACFAALATPNSTVLVGCMTGGAFNQTCLSGVWCPYFDLYAACMPTECCTSTMASTVQELQATLDAAQVTANASCSARMCASGMASAASGASPPIAATAAALLAALAASRW
mmetsp:Transcript_51186/g.111528  ORF Transcript_51186/g.111528 Transcript_51186/m.111528 type:complete len:140 (+) Transcript_51186:58-477(+)